MASKPTINIAVIGAGLIGPRHASAIQKTPGARLVCLIDPSASAATVAESFSVPLYSSLDNALSSDITIDAAVVSTPNHTHVSLTIELLRANLGVLVEKPLSTSLVSAQPLVDYMISNPSHPPILVGHHRRFNPYMTSTKALLTSMALGRVIAVSGTWCTSKPASYFLPPTQWRASSSSGGVVRINLIHDIDCLQYLLGPVIRVSAEKMKSVRGHEAEGGAAVLLRFESGVVGTFVVCDGVASARNFESGTGENPLIPQGGREFLRIFGTQSSVGVGGDGGLEKFIEQDGQEWGWGCDVAESKLEFDKSVVPFEEQMKHFVKVVRREEKPLCSVRDGLRAVAVCEAVIEAMETNTSVDVVDAEYRFAIP